MVDIREATEKLGFEYCDACGLIWCDKMGKNELMICPRCSRDNELSEMDDKICDLESDRDEAMGELDITQERLGELESLVGDMRKVF